MSTIRVHLLTLVMINAWKTFMALSSSSCWRKFKSLLTVQTNSIHAFLTICVTCLSDVFTSSSDPVELEWWVTFDTFVGVTGTVSTMFSVTWLGAESIMKIETRFTSLTHVISFWITRFTFTTMRSETLFSLWNTMIVLQFKVWSTS
jgi:hypothetical protein